MRIKGIPDQGILKIARTMGMAFEAEPAVHGDQYAGIEEYPGFHTTGDFTIAATYAIGRVSQSYTEENEDGAHHVTDYPVVVSVDMSGLQPVVDYDAVEISWPILVDQISALSISPEMTDEEIEDEVVEYVEMGDFSSGESSMHDDAIHQLSDIAFHSMQNPLGGIMHEPGLGGYIRQFLLDGSFPDDLKMKAADQYRYVSDTSSERILKVWFVKPVAEEHITSLENGDDGAIEAMEARWPGFDLFDEDALFGGYADYKSEEVWDGGSQEASDQQNLFSDEQIQSTATVSYHGTTLSRLLQAAPHLEGQLPAPPSPPYQS